jgi:exopolysaccharide biosynthesis protein
MGGQRHVGGQPIVRDGAAVAGFNNTTARRAAPPAWRADGRRLYLVSLHRNAPGMTYLELANLLLSVGAAAGVNLDGGGSSTIVTRDPGASAVTIKNLLPADFERPVPNGIGVFAYA